MCCCSAIPASRASIIMFLFLFFFQSSRHHRDLHSFPTRRSSDSSCVPTNAAHVFSPMRALMVAPCSFIPRSSRPTVILYTRDRKSTRLNSSYVKISYAVFCLKKKKLQECFQRPPQYYQ